MITQLLCPDCAERTHLHPEDVSDGWHLRKKHIVAKKPEGLHITIQAGDSLEDMETKQEIPIDVMVCDLCNAMIPDGSKAVAVTSWRDTQEAEPGEWEKEYSL